MFNNEVNQPLPPYYIIETTNICNFCCPICPNSFYKTDRGYMHLSLLENILEQISLSAKVIQLYWLGEPLMDKKIFEKIAMCKSITNAKIILSTNGSLLTKENIVKLRESGLDEIIVSIDACESQDIYGEIRVGGDIQKLNTNLKLLLSDCGTVRVVLQFIDMYINKSELALFQNKWKQHQTDILPLYTWANQIPALNLASDHLSYVKYKERTPCADLWNKMAIHWNGNVSACCFDFSDKIHLGNCINQTLGEIWNGQEARRIRSEHIKGCYEGLCKFCDSWAEPNEYDYLYHLNK